MTGGKWFKHCESLVCGLLGNKARGAVGVDDVKPIGFIVMNANREKAAGLRSVDSLLWGR